jgi:hypothetical protein
MACDLDLTLNSRVGSMDLSPCTIQEFGANVKVAIFCDFLTKIGVFFLKTNFTVKFWQKIAVFSVKTANFFRENIFKIVIAVLRCEFQVTDCKVVKRCFVENQVVGQSYCRTYKLPK